MPASCPHPRVPCSPNPCHQVLVFVFSFILHMTMHVYMCVCVCVPMLPRVCAYVRLILSSCMSTVFLRQGDSLTGLEFTK